MESSAGQELKGGDLALTKACAGTSTRMYTVQFDSFVLHEVRSHQHRVGVHPVRVGYQQQPSALHCITGTSGRLYEGMEPPKTPFISTPVCSRPPVCSQLSLGPTTQVATTLLHVGYLCLGFHRFDIQHQDPAAMRHPIKLTPT